MTALSPSCLLLLLLAWITPLAAEPLDARPALNEQSIVAVVSAALSYMAPRTLEPHPTGQLAIWGLRGLTTLDPRLVAEWSPTANTAATIAANTKANSANLRLSVGGKVLADLPPPPQGNAQAWGEAIGILSRAAWDASEPVRRAGNQGILRSFFDELFNHLDPYSRYVSPTDADADDNRRNGRAGIGIELGHIATGFVVRKVAEGSPANGAGIRPGEMVLEIDGEPLDGADLPTVTALMAGPEGTLISLTLRTAGHAPRAIDLVRELITPQTVFAQRQSDLIVIRITSFAHDTAETLVRELGRLLTANRPAHGLVIDLRGNRGGLLRSAVDAANSLLAHGIIAITAGRDPQAAHEYRADATDRAYGLPIVIIVDGRTASAAEVLAAALADQRRAVVIGSATLGKGLVQTILPLPDGGALSLTWSRILAPLGWPLQALGVLPQVCTSLGEDTLKRQLAELVQGRQPMARSLTHHREARAPLPPADILEIRSACPASEGRDQDVATAKYLIETPAAYGAALIPQPASP